MPFKKVKCCYLDFSLACISYQASLSPSSGLNTYYGVKFLNIVYQISKKCMLSFWKNFCDKSYVKNMKASSTLSSAKCNRSLFCRVCIVNCGESLLVASGMSSNCLKNTMINSIMCSCFSFLCSLYRQSAKCSISTAHTLFLRNASLYSLKYLCIYGFILQSSVGN